MNAHISSPKGRPPAEYTLRERCQAIQGVVRDLADQAIADGFTPDAACRIIEDAARRHARADQPLSGRKRLSFSPVPF
jgi:hypothetical protein